jgi:hypothetical protein
MLHFLIKHLGLLQCAHVWAQYQGTHSYHTARLNEKNTRGTQIFIEMFIFLGLHLLNFF